jgi:hypothetical protein
VTADVPDGDIYVDKTYEKPQIADHGTLQDLTAACPGGSGGDMFAPSGQYGSLTFGPTNPAYNCTSS